MAVICTITIYLWTCACDKYTIFFILVIICNLRWKIKEKSLTHFKQHTNGVLPPPQYSLPPTVVFWYNTKPKMAHGFGVTLTYSKLICNTTIFVEVFLPFLICELWASSAPTSLWSAEERGQQHSSLRYSMFISYHSLLKCRNSVCCWAHKTTPRNRDRSLLSTGKYPK